MKKITIVLCLISIYFAACGEKDEPLSKLQLPGTFVFDLNEGTEYAFEAFNLVFEKEINEYRCPSSVVCVWEGNAEVHFNFEQTGVDTIEEYLAIYNQRSREEGMVNEKEIAGYLFRLISITPEPDKIGDSSSIAEIMIEKL